MKINKNENLQLKLQDINDIRLLFGSDMRSMINFMQTTNGPGESINIIRTGDWKKLLTACNHGTVKKVTELLKQFCNRGYAIKNIFSEFLHFIILNHPKIITADLLSSFEFIIHHDTNHSDLILQYFISDCLPHLMIGH
jgi:DNA polymerase III delta prime subunit